MGLFLIYFPINKFKKKSGNSKTVFKMVFSKIQKKKKRVLLHFNGKRIIAKIRCHTI